MRVYPDSPDPPTPYSDDDIDTLVAGEGDLAFPAHKGTLMRLVATLQRQKAHLLALETVLCEAAPLDWAAKGDMAGAQAWEKRTFEALEGWRKAVKA